MKKFMALFLAGVMMATMAVGVSAAPKKKVVRIEVVSKGYQHNSGEQLKREHLMQEQNLAQILTL